MDSKPAVFVDGWRVAVDPRQIVLTEREEILVAYGTQAELPRPLPTSYAFAPGL